MGLYSDLCHAPILARRGIWLVLRCAIAEFRRKRVLVHSLDIR